MLNESRLDVPMSHTPRTEGSPSPKAGAPSPRNAWIDICRLLAGVAIMCFHFPLPDCPVRLVSGALLVEYFFMLTGYFALSRLRRTGEGTEGILPYMGRFYLRVLPFVVVGTGLEYASELMASYPDWGGMLHKVLLFPFEVLLLQGTNVYQSLYHVLWYLSVTLVCLPVVMYAYRRLPGVWRYVTVAGAVLCYGYLMQTVGTLRVNHDIVNTCLRAFGGMLSGGTVMLLSDWLRSRKVGRWGRIALLAGEILCLVVAGILMCQPDMERTQYDSVTVLFLLVSLVISLSGQTATSRIPSTRLVSWMASTSLAVYCLHYGVFDLMKEMTHAELDNGLTVIGWLLTLVAATGLVGAVRLAGRLRGHRDARRDADPQPTA